MCIVLIETWITPVSRLRATRSPPLGQTRPPRLLHVTITPAIVASIACKLLELPNGHFELTHCERPWHRHVRNRRFVVPFPRAALERTAVYHNHPWTTPALAVLEFVACWLADGRIFQRNNRWSRSATVPRVNESRGSADVDFLINMLLLVFDKDVEQALILCELVQSRCVLLARRQRTFRSQEIRSPSFAFVVKRHANEVDGISSLVCDRQLVSFKEHNLRGVAQISAVLDAGPCRCRQLNVESTVVPVPFFQHDDAFVPRRDGFVLSESVRPPRFLKVWIRLDHRDCCPALVRDDQTAASVEHHIGVLA